MFLNYFYMFDCNLCFLYKKKKLSVYFDGPLEYSKSLEKKIDIYVYV